ncbi:glycosyltransferase [Staphylococcus simiae]|uniref:glycosyltransferase n=1 Tax=Staphylococcus simiae TaxID=308354 RepID=UPI001A97C2A6|nr:glycosyltransferase [Staphylococcus simiae]MBO1199411.1 glycosyltransferase [Staphylococcus simiae]MBO1201853.1 glycosyltransferase [Staphylococcus simiae]MBO1204067.1 glycosyltransferase [Staphylococcus simiae]MBO1211123.1 glycosyltransferase [Staphylococcus simiae]MBO1230319.1 glycosyltransferase [Staphylococcus simiae]
MSIIFVTSRLDKDHGGLTASLLNKTRILYDYNKIKSKILTFHADQNFNNIKNEIQRRYELENKTDILNINEYFRERGLKYTTNKYSVDISDLTKVKVNDSTTEFYNNGIKRLEIKYKNNILTEVKHFTDNSICFKKDIVDHDGFLYWTSFYIDAKLSRQIFYRKDGSAFQSREYDSTNNKKNIKNIVLFDDSILRFNSFDEFKTYFIEKFIEDRCTYIIGEARAQDSVILNINDSRVRKIFMTHSIHERPDTKIIRLGNRKVLNNLNKIDGLVLLTNKQRGDIIKRFGERNNYYVIPHSIEIPKVVTKKDPNKIVIISRLHEEKRLDHAIKAFKKVIQKSPDAKLYIYGDGDQKESLQNLINKLNVQHNVKLMGYTNNTNEVLQSATCSILTSKYEGFALVIQESIANGTPVIAYDIKYGPSDMIDNEKNGFLVSDGNIDELAATIIAYLNVSNNKKKKYSEEAVIKAKSFSNERFAESWLKLFEDLKSPKIRIEPQVRLTKVERNTLSKNNFKIEVEMEINNSINDITPKFWGTFYNRSTINNEGIKNNTRVETTVKKVRQNIYIIDFYFKANEFQKNEIYDVFLSMQYDSNYFDLRIGNQRKDINIEKIKTRRVTPYFTQTYDNLSFKL